MEVRVHLDSNGQDLTVEHIRRCLDYNPETGRFIWTETLSNAAPAGYVAGTLSGRGYVSIQFEGRLYRAHRLAWFYVYGSWPTGQIDHINGITSDNRIANLRDATCSQNQANVGRRSDNKSGYKGVCLHKPTGKWSSSVQHEGRRFHLGLFGSKEQAAVAYGEMLKKLKGSFARVS